MKKIQSIAIMAAFAGLTLAGCEYHHYQTFASRGWTPVSQASPAPEEETGVAEEEIVPTDPGPVTEDAVAGDAVVGSGNESPEDEAEFPYFQATVVETRPSLHTSESAEDLLGRLRGDAGESTITERIREAARTGPLTLDSRPKQYIVSLAPPFRPEGSTAREGGIAKEGNESSVGDCDPLAFEIGAGFSAARSEVRRNGIQPLLDFSLGCLDSWSWTDPFASVTPETQSRWEEDIRYGEVAGEAFSTAGRALKGFRLFRCYSGGLPGGMLDDAFCGVEGLFVPVRPDGDVVGEAQGLTFPGSSYDYSHDASVVTVQCQEAEQVVTAMKVWRSKSHPLHDETVRWIEITCSRIVKR
ncbi:MAG TPA: hypothetical protein VLJ37_07415 [bacterium]|nr:hypothetical protein [bacterium]